jgi:hypothetical protein
MLTSAVWDGTLQPEALSKTVPKHTTQTKKAELS